MNIKKLTFVGVILLLLLGATGCDKGKSDGAARDKLCLYLNSENLDKTIPIINDFLAELKSNLSNEQKLQALVEWLKSCTCVSDATVLCVGCIYTLPAQSEISFTFKESGITKNVILDILMNDPLRAGICSINEQDD